MRVLLCLLALAVLAASDNVLHLNERNFESSIKGKSAFVKFFAPWCGHCKAMRPAWDQLADHFASRPGTVIADVDCTVEEGLCGKFSVQGFPTIKYFTKDSPDGEGYEGGRDFGDLKSFAEENLAGAVCSLEAKEECDPESLKILEMSEKMGKAERRSLIKDVEQSIADKKKEAEKLKEEAETLEEHYQLVELGGQKPEGVNQLLSDDDFREECGSKVCIIAFLPNIIEGGAKERNRLLKLLNEARKADDKKLGFLWLQGGDNFEIEEKLNLQFGFPAVVAVHLKKHRFGVHRGTFDNVKTFPGQMMTGRVPLAPLPDFKFADAEPWDGKDGEVRDEL